MRVQRPKAITLDFYNTLVFHRAGSGRGHALMAFLEDQGYSPGPWEHRILYELFADHGTAYSPKASDADRQLYFRELAQRMFLRLGIEVSPEVSARYATAVWEILGPQSLAKFPDVGATLKILSSSGLPLAVLSNWQSGLSHFCEELGLLPFFDHVLSSAELGFQKPDVRAFEEASARLGISPEEILHVGDTMADDYLGARAAGFQALLIEREGISNGATAGAIRSLEELPRVLGIDAEGPFRA